MTSVLVVEDDLDIRESVVEALEAEGHRVVGVGSAREALGALGAPGRPRLVLLDLRMSGMDGLGFLDALAAREDRSDFAVILMSADRKVSHLADAPGVVAVLRKPFELAELLVLVERFAPSRE